MAKQNLLLVPQTLRRSARGPGVARKGVAAVEFAVVSPILFMLLLGMVEMGRALMVQQVLTNASREAARVAIVSSASASGVTTAATNYTTNARVNGATATVSPDPTAALPGTTLTVTVSVPYGSVTWVPLPKYLANAQLTASSSMRKEGFQ